MQYVETHRKQTHVIIRVVQAHYWGAEESALKTTARAFPRLKVMYEYSYVRLTKTEVETLETLNREAMIPVTELPRYAEIVVLMAEARLNALKNTTA